MIKKRRIAGFLLGPVMCLAAAPAGANTILLHLQGSSPNRTAVYADTLVMDDTPLSADLYAKNDRIEPIKRLAVTMVFEAPEQPYFTKMDLQFRCPPTLLVPKNAGRKEKAKGGQAQSPMPETVAYRLSGGFTRRKDSPDTTQLSPTDWQTTTGMTMRHAHQVACNDIEINNAIARAGSDAAQRYTDAGDVGRFVSAEFSRQMASLGLNNTALLPGGMLWPQLAELTWTTAWSDVKMPAIDNGRPMTAEERATFDRKLADAQAMLDRDKAEVLGSIQQKQQEFKFREEAARLRGGRNVSKTEAQMLIPWLDKTERDVVIAMGAPTVSEAGGVRFLSYGQDYDSRYVVQRVFTGEAWTQGVYKSCNIQFVLIPDAQAQFRVADVVVTAFRSGDGWAPDLCAELTEAPR